MNTLRRLWPFYRPGWLLVLVSLLQIGTAAGLGVLQPLVIRWVVDQVLTAGRWNLLITGAVTVVGLSAVQGVLRFGQRYTMELVSQRVVYQVRSKLYQHLQSLSFGFYDRAQTGELMSRVTADVEAMRQAMGLGTVNGLMHLSTVVGIITSMLLVDWRLAVVALVFLPFLVLALRTYSRRTTPAWTDIQRRTASLSALLQENIAGVRVVRAFAREEAESAKFRVENAGFLTANLKTIRMNSFWTNYMNFLTAVGAVVVVWYGGRRAIAGQISVGTLIAFNAYVSNLVNPIRNLGWIVGMFTRAQAGASRIFELLDTRSDVQEKPGAQELGRLTGHVTLEHVSFGYAGSARVLDDIHLEIAPGTKVAILGMTGSGKSSLIHLIPRFYDPTQGRILVGDTDVRDVTLESLRRNIGIVLQETFLFSTTLRENIAYGKTSAKLDDVIAAAKAAQIHEFINSLPDKYETVVGERGVGLSGGQKQRVAIARAFLMDSPILLLDESTSAVDVQTEHLIQKAMDEVIEHRTAFIIASRLTTVMNADLVVVLEEGRVAEVGKHADLIQRDGLYRKIYDLQLKPAEEYKAQQSATKGVAV